MDASAAISATIASQGDEVIKAGQEPELEVDSNNALLEQLSNVSHADDSIPLITTDIIADFEGRSGSPEAVDLAPRLRFFRFSQTVNEEHLVDLLEGDERHGEYVLHATESSLARRSLDWHGKCFYADVLAMYRSNDKDYLVGIEIKDWKNTVHPKMCYEYLKTYRTSCEYFYIAARHFSSTIFQIPEIGLINLDTMEVVKEPEYLFPNKEYRMEVVRRLKKITRTERNILEDPYQLSLEKWTK